MIDNSCCIIVPTNSKYIDICKNFMDVLKRSWSDCPYRVIVSITGENKKIDGVINLYNGSDASLIDCIVNASNIYKCDYYMVFLGDAFMCGNVETYKVKNLLEDMKKYEIDFCCLHPEKSRKKIKKIGKQMRYIHVKDRYCHCFGYILCSKKYIDEMFVKSGILTDLEYEVWYLNKSMESETNYYYEHDAIVIENVFNIICGIKKGKWDRIAYHWIKKNYPEIKLAMRPQLGILNQIMMILRQRFLYLIPDGLRIWIKKNVTRITGKKMFDTMN